MPWTTAAKAALRRKKQHEHSLEQTLGQIGTLDQQINAIESANINRETLAAMERASEAMKQIHGKLTPEKVDDTMYVHKVIIYCYEIFLTGSLQVEATRAKCSQRGDCGGYEQRQPRQRDRRGRSRRRTGGPTTGATRRADAEDRHRTGVGCRAATACGCQRRA